MPLGPDVIVAKIIELGEPYVGKTTLRRRFLGESLHDNYLPTLGVDFSLKRLEYRNQVFRMMIWDLAGDQRYNVIRPGYYQGANGCLAVYDLTRPETFYKLSDWLREFRTYVSDNWVPLVVVGNKLDLVGDFSKSEIKEEDVKDLIEYAKTSLGFFRVNHILTSALTGVNVVESFELIADTILEKIGF